MSYNGIIFFLKQEAWLTLCPNLSCACFLPIFDLPLPNAPELTLLCPILQSQFLCLAVQKGTLVLFYDFGSGLKKAEPLQPPQALTAASKAVRQEAWGQDHQWRDLAFLKSNIHPL